MGEYLFIASAIFSIVNGTVLLWVNPRRVVNKVFFGSSLWIAIWCLCVAMAISEGNEAHSEPNPALIFWLRISSAVAAYLGWLLSMMAASLVDEKITLTDTISRTWFWLLVATTGATLAFSESFIRSDSLHVADGRGAGYAAYLFLMITGCLTLMVSSWKHLRHLSGIRKLEMRFFVLSFACACLLALGSSGIGHVLSLPWLRRLGPVWVLGLHGITVWAACYHRVFDAKQIVSSAAQRIVLLIFLSFSALILNQLLSHSMEPTWSFVGATIVVCTLGIIFDAPMRRWFRLDTRHLLLAPRRVIIEWARRISDEEELKAKFNRLLCDWCQTNSVNLLPSSGRQFAGSGIVVHDDWSGFVELCKEGWTTPETLHRSRPSVGTAECADLMQRHQLGALLAVPMGSLPPSLIIGLGQKESLRPYTFPEVQALLELAELMDNILTHSRVATHAAHIERMASATMISRGLAHDLNNLATPVSTFLHHMDERVTPGSIEAKVLADAKSSIRVMQDYIQESLFFARQLVPSFTVINAHPVLSDVIRLSTERAREKNVHVIICEHPDFSFVADFSLLRRLLQNLVFNGIDASPSGATIEVSAIVADDQQVCWQVADHGSGIPPEARNRIFEPYFTTKNLGSERRGLGLGLAICQKIAEVHGGRISVSSNSPQGTVFTTIFPRRNTLSALSPAITEEPVSQAEGLLKRFAVSGLFKPSMESNP